MTLITAILLRPTPRPETLRRLGQFLDVGLKTSVWALTETLDADCWIVVLAPRSGVGAATDSIGNFLTLEYILP